MNPVVMGMRLAMAAALLGLLSRRRARLSLMFATYLAVGLATAIVADIWPESFGQRTWMAYQGVYDLMKLGIALEIAWRTFRLFPGARAAAHRLGLAVLAATAVVALLAPVTTDDPDPYVVAITLVTPRVQNGILWLMAVTLAVALWYRVPVHPFHAGILTSFVAYQAVYVALLSLLARGFNERREVFAVVDNAAFLLAGCWWTYAAWRPESTTATAHAAMLRRLQLGFGGDLTTARGDSS